MYTLRSVQQCAVLIVTQNRPKNCECGTLDTSTPSTNGFAIHCLKRSSRKEEVVIKKNVLMHLVQNGSMVFGATLSMCTKCTALKCTTEVCNLGHSVSYQHDTRCENAWYHIILQPCIYCPFAHLLIYKILCVGFRLHNKTDDSINFNPIFVKTVCYKHYVYSDVQTVACNLRSWWGVSRRRSRR